MSNKHKYPWQDAPEWAQYAATDLDGRAYWYEQEPVTYADEWIVPDQGKHARIKSTNLDWHSSLEARPVVVDDGWIYECRDKHSPTRCLYRINGAWYSSNGSGIWPSQNLVVIRKLAKIKQ